MRYTVIGWGACRMSGGERLLALAAAGRPSTQLGGSSALPVGLRTRRCDRERVRYADSCARSGWLRGLVGGARRGVHAKWWRASVGGGGGRETQHPAGRIERAACGPQSPQVRPRARPLRRLVRSLGVAQRSCLVGGARRGVHAKWWRASVGSGGGRETPHPAGRIERAACGPQSPQPASCDRPARPARSATLQGVEAEWEKKG
jgi:hypothetical protein